MSAGRRTVPDRLRVCFFGTYDAGAHQRVAVLREGFASLGDEVIGCNAPLRFPTARRVELLRRPWRLTGLLARIIGTWARLLVASTRVRRPDVVIVGYLGVADVVLARLRWPRATVVLDHMAPVAETAADRGAGAAVVTVAKALDRVAEAASSVVLIDTDEALAHLGRRARGRALVVPVGATSSWDADPPATHGEGTLRVVLFSTFAPLHGAPVVGEAISLLAGSPGISFTIIGHGQELGETRRRAGDRATVTWHEWIEPAELPAVVADHDVCLGIFGTGAKALRVVPNKVFQGMAAGCAVITSDTPPQRRLLGDACLYVPPGDAPALAAAIDSLHQDPGALAERRLAGRVAAGQRFSPPAIVAELRRAIGDR